MCGGSVESGFLNEYDGRIVCECFYVCDHVFLSSKPHLIGCVGREGGHVIRCYGEGGDRGGERFDVVEARG